ncbi:GNAT family N-acetyltransferase [Photobacterium sp. 1_MG-2023]|uniref:GNAT family N-acetyltransferase n=1 Tax=Photobacterium sp. 1_MG-2023 TaxID=3062646 RepID=UPI0026E1A0C1|nr:GNAT family N-acetyltransferase [Photobacterium sp. 1_MG-2023]MDO6709021.1 GNAT family N-acetyltransferase [Photobacterium sp. 1_MG-2023]
MEHIIRTASESDVLGINEVSKYLGYAELSSSESLSKLQELLNSAQDQVYVAESDGRILGWLHLFYARRLASESFFEIGGLVVSPEARGKGIGKALVKYAQKKNKGDIRVRCNELRKDTQEFYEAIGFGVNKVQRVFLKNG